MMSDDEGNPQLSQDFEILIKNFELKGSTDDSSSNYSPSKANESGFLDANDDSNKL